MEDGLSKTLFLLCGLRPSHVVGVGVGQGWAQGFGTPALVFPSPFSPPFQNQKGWGTLAWILSCSVLRLFRQVPSRPNKEDLAGG